MLPAMNLLDIVLAVLLALTTVYGLWKGFVRIAFGVAGLAVSLAAALRLAARGPSWFEGVFRSDQLARVLAFALVLAAGLLATAVLAFLARRLVKSAEIGWIDRLIGALVGVGGGCLAVSGLLVGLTAFLPPGSTVLGESALAPYALVVSDLAARILPPDLARLYQERRDALDRLRRGEPRVPGIEWSRSAGHRPS